MLPSDAPKRSFAALGLGRREAAYVIYWTLTMPTTRFEPSSIKNKFKREEVFRKTKKASGRQKLQRRLARAKAEANDPTAKRVSVPHKYE